MSIKIIKETDTFKLYTNEESKTICEFVAYITEDYSNDTLYYYTTNDGLKSTNIEDYDLVRADKNLNGVPYVGGEIRLTCEDSIEYIKSIVACKNYDGNVTTKLIKRIVNKNTEATIFARNKNQRFTGVINKGATVKVKAIIEEYTQAGKLRRKLTPIGLLVLRDGEAKGTEYAEVYHDEDVKAKPQVVDNSKELEDIKDLLVEMSNTFKKEFDILKEEIKIVKEELAKTKAELEKKNKPVVELKEEEDLVLDFNIEDYGTVDVSVDQEDDYDMPF